MEGREQSTEGRKAENSRGEEWRIERARKGKRGTEEDDAAEGEGLKKDFRSEGGGLEEED